MKKIKSSISLGLVLSLTLVVLPARQAQAQVGLPGGSGGGCTTPACVGAFGFPFAEPTILGQATSNKCIEDADGVLRCKPAAGSIAILRDGRILYWNALEGTENVELSIVGEFGRVSVNDQSRVLTLGSNDAPSWIKPSPVDAGAVNTDDETIEFPIIGGGLDTNDASQSNNGALFCSDLNALPDGRIMAVGGTDYYSEVGVEGFPYGVVELEGLKNARIFNPGTNAWTQTGSMAYGRWYPTIVTLADGNTFVVSGVTKLIKPVYPDRPINSGRNVVQTETYNLDCGTWSENGPLAERSLPLFARIHLLPNGSVFYNAAGQAYNPSGQGYDQALWNIQGAYGPQARSWTDLAYAGFPLQLNQVGLETLTTALNITNPAHLTLLTASLVGSTMQNPAALANQLTGLTGRNVSASEVDRALGSGFRGSTFSIMLPLRPDSNGHYARAEFLTSGGIPGDVVFTNPGTHFGTDLSRIDTITQTGNSLTSTSRLTGKLNNKRWYPSGVLLPDGSVMVFNGADRDEVTFPGGAFPIRQAERFDPATEKWTRMATANNARTYHNTAALMPDGRVMIAGHAPITTAYTFHTTLPGGFSPNDGRDPSFEIYSPPYIFRNDRPTINNAPRDVNYGQTFNVQTPNAGSIASVVLIRQTVTTHLVDADQRSVELRIVSRNPNSVTVQMPQADAVLPPGPYLLFINRATSTGLVPSVSKLVMVRRRVNTICQS